MRTTLLLLAAALATAAISPAEPLEDVRLVVFIVVDQLGYETLERLAPHFEHGLAKLRDESVTFAEVHHQHAVTRTAPGHATLVTGLHPARHGIVDNAYWDRERARSVGATFDDECGHTMTHLEGSTLGDWLKARHPRARVVSVSGKSRSALLMGGRTADLRVWYDSRTGHFVGIPAPPPEPLRRYSRELRTSLRFGSVWEQLPVTRMKAADLGARSADHGRLSSSFPHVLGGLATAPGDAYFHDYSDSPFLDSATTWVALQLIASEGLGQDAHPDLLLLSYSALDNVGHRYGPSSPEAIDTLLRLDLAVGRLLASLDASVGLAHTLVSVTSDHGSRELPEAVDPRENPLRRVGLAEIACVQGLDRRLRKRLGGSKPWLEHDMRINPEALEESELDREAVEASAREELETCPGITRVWTRSELRELGPGASGMAELYAHSFHPTRGPDLYVQWAEDVLPEMGSEADHGSPYETDRRVPWLVRFPDGRKGQIQEAVATTDVAPSLAHLLGLDAPPRLDGRSRSRSLLRTP